MALLFRGVACMALGFSVISGCASEAVPLSSKVQTVSAGAPVSSQLFGLMLGQGATLQSCAGREDLTAACAIPQPGQSGGMDRDGIYALHLPADSVGSGWQHYGSVVRLGGLVESVGLVVEGAQPVNDLAQRLNQLCGTVAYDSQMALPDGSQLLAMAWQCDAQWVTLNAVGMSADEGWQASVTVSTDTGRTWLEAAHMLTVEAPALAVVSP